MQRILITGANRGIGFELTRRFAGQGGFAETNARKDYSRCKNAH